MRRLATFPADRSTTAVEWYSPTDVIRGGFARALPAATPAEVGLRAAALERAADWADRMNSSALLVMRSGRVALERYWRGCGRDVPTVSQSMAKTLLALLIGTAIERGEIGSIDDPIARHVTEWRGEPRGEIALRDLLRMESGLQNDDAREDPFSAIVQMHLSTDLLPVVLGLRRDRPPGRDHEYNNFNSQLLGLALERATGRRYAALLSERIWQPIGARDAAVWLDRAGGNAKVYGAVIATARDWARVGELVRHRGRVGDRAVVPASWFDAIERPSPHRREYGMHLWLGAGDPARGVPPYVYLDGKSKQRVFVVRSHELVIVRTGENARGWSDAELVRLVVAASE